MKLGADFQDWTAIYVQFLCTLLNWASNNTQICDETTDGVERSAIVRIWRCNYES
jgi:hypothetical protein